MISLDSFLDALASLRKKEKGCHEGIIKEKAAASFLRRRKGNETPIPGGEDDSERRSPD